MSVDKEPVPTNSTKVDAAPTLPPQQLSACTGSFTSSPKVPGATVDHPKVTDSVATFPLVDSCAQTKHSRSADSNDQQKSVSQEAMVTKQHLNPKNGLQQPKQQQHQKLSKRRSTINAGFKHPAGKRRRRANSESDSVLPTNFLLGGNIFDPLNLNSLLDEDVNRALNAETPRSSPLPAKNRDPVEILIPRDITDPLNLNSQMEGRGVLVSPFKSGGRRRHRHRHHGGGGVGASSISGLDLSDSERAIELTNTAASSLSNRLSAGTVSASVQGAASVPAALVSQGDNGNGIHPSSSLNEAVLPLPAHQAQPRAPADSSAAAPGGANQLTSRQRKRRRNSGKAEILMARQVAEERGRGGSRKNAQSSFHTPVVGPRGSTQVAASRQQPHNQHKQQQQQRNKKMFQYGNYNKYYGYRNPGCVEDPRFRCLRREWFQGKAVLDLGCNTGHLTLCIAKKLRPARILGLDIDGDLVHAARQNIRHYLSEVLAQEARSTAETEKNRESKDEKNMESEEEKNRGSKAEKTRGSEENEEKYSGSEQERKEEKNSGSAQERKEEKNSGSEQERKEEKNSGSEQERKEEKNSGSEQERKEEKNSGSEQERKEEKNSGSEQERKEEKAGGPEEMGEALAHTGKQMPKQDKPDDMECSKAEIGDAGKQLGKAGGPVEAEDGVVTSRHTKRRAQETAANEMEEEDSGEQSVELGTSSFPISLRISRGPIAAPPLPETATMPPGNFPSNVSFAKGNYVLDSDALLVTQRPEYDIILCFSVTKWVHLNWGDSGLKRLFHRVFRHLRPGGLFILEPQPWTTYGKRKKLTENIYKNYQSIRLKPEDFSTYLTSKVGFSSYELIGVPNNLSKGFQRPIYLFHKGT
ncbi:hypothetical protein UPYG_G00117210 [Umbra pygmaea]|uniref:RNA methyltransferase n=1 Tax=Umbra pygmaea TaxID=75934 RepID=A0ABD0X7L9_UMBPY